MAAILSRPQYVKLLPPILCVVCIISQPRLLYNTTVWFIGSDQRYKYVAIYKARDSVCSDILLHNKCALLGFRNLIVRRAGLLWSQQDFEWRWSVPLFKCLTALEFSFILFDLCLLITFFNFIMNYVPIVTFWIFTYHKIWILSIMSCFIWSYWIIYFLACLEVSWRVVS